MPRELRYKNLEFMRSPAEDYVESFLGNRNSYFVSQRFIQGEKLVRMDWGYQEVEFPHANRRFDHAYLTRTETWIRNGVQVARRIHSHNRYNKTITRTGTISGAEQSLTYTSPTSAFGPTSLINETKYIELSDPWHVADARLVMEGVMTSTPDPEYTTYVPGNPPTFRQDLYGFDSVGNVSQSLNRSGLNFPYPSVKYFYGYFAVSNLRIFDSQNNRYTRILELLKAGTLIENVKYCHADYSAYKTDPTSSVVNFTPARNCSTATAGTAKVNVVLGPPPTTLDPMPELGFAEYRWLFYPGFVNEPGRYPPIAPCCILT